MGVQGDNSSWQGRGGSATTGEWGKATQAEPQAKRAKHNIAKDRLRQTQKKRSHKKLKPTRKSKIFEWR